MTSPSLFDAEFALDPAILYLNHAAVAPWPTRTRDAASAFAAENARVGSLHYKRWMQTEAELRQRLATLINAPAVDDIALLKSTSEGLSVVAHGLHWEPGDTIIISDEEFPSNRIVWESLRPLGVNVREVNLNAAASPEEALLDAVDDHTRLIAISSVQYGSGLRVDLETIGHACRERDILFCVDAIQSIGAVAFDVDRIQADFVVADGHKWMLGPEGLALFYCRAALRERLALHQYGWHMIEHMGDFGRREWEPASNARRFECGSPNMLGIHALSASVSLLLEIGMDEVERGVLANAETLFDLIERSHHLQCLTNRNTGRYAGIVVFSHDQYNAEPLYEALMDKGVMCAARGGGIRFSPHFYTSRETLERAVAIADNIKL
jgi:selenocysteine lyase/cysteine desulfurase